MGRILDDLTGRRFNSAVVVERAPMPDRNYSPATSNVTFWKIRCDCGNEKVVARPVLLRGTFVSCGEGRKRCRK